MAKGTTTAPIERKVAIPSGVAIVVTLISWFLVTYVPVFKTGVPPTLAALLPGAVAWAIATVAAYYTKHTPREVQTDIAEVIKEALAAYEESHPAPQPLAPVKHSGEVTITHHSGGIGVSMTGGAGGSAPIRPFPEGFPTDLKEPATDAGQPPAGEAWPSG